MEMNNLNIFLDKNQFKIKTIDLNEGKYSDFRFLINLIGNSEDNALYQTDKTYPLWL